MAGDVRPDHVTRLVRAAREHDAAVKAKGYKADEETDRLMSVYRAVRREATDAELAVFQEIYGDEEYEARQLGWEGDEPHW